MRFCQQWTATGCDGFSFPARVPGTVQSDYAKARNWGDIQYADNIYRFETIEDWSWTYQTNLDFHAEADGAASGKVRKRKLEALGRPGGAV